MPMSVLSYDVDKDLQFILFAPLSYVHSHEKSYSIEETQIDKYWTTFTNYKLT